MNNITVTKTQNPRPRPAGALGFGKYFTDHMFIMEYDTKNGWHSPSIIPYAPFMIEPSAMVFHYGQADFEGLKAYKTKDGRTLLFRPRDNFLRLNTSNARICIPPIDVDLALAALKTLIKLDEDWIPSEANESLYIRPFIIATEGALGVRPSETYKFMIILSPSGPYYAEGLNAVKIYVEDDYVRSVVGLTGNTKAAANYAQSLKGQIAAQQKGYTQVLWLDGIHRKYIEEVGTMNVFFKIAGKVITPALSGSILPGITRDSVIQILKSRGIPVEERPIDINEVFAAYDNGELEEIFGTGTAAVISPVGELFYTGRSITINNKETGEISKELYSTLVGIQYGEREDTFNWTYEV